MTERVTRVSPTSQHLSPPDHPHTTQLLHQQYPLDQHSSTLIHPINAASLLTPKVQAGEMGQATSSNGSPEVTDTDSIISKLIA